MNNDELVDLLKFETNYPNFMAFYSACEESIYRKIMEIHENFKITNEEQKKLIVIANIDGFIFDTNFMIKKNDTKLLKEVIRPYFEKMEDYETCDKIVKLCCEV